MERYRKSKKRSRRGKRLGSYQVTRGGIRL